MAFSSSNKRLALSLAVYAGWVAITLGVGRLLSDGKKHPLADSISHSPAWNIIAAAAFVVGMAWLFGWRDLRFVQPRPWKSLRVMWLPALYIIAFLSMSAYLGPVPVAVMGYVFVNTLFVGLSEEAMFRGVLFRALAARVRPWPAVILTCLLFGSVHVLNVFGTGEFWPAVIQAATAAMSGLAFVAIVLRTGSIWPAIIYHALWDFGTFMLSNHTMALDKPGAVGGYAFLIPALLVLPNFLFGLYLLRNLRNDTRLDVEGDVLRPQG
jgi:membrane protease YdiL (CAAX protease family)